MRSEDAGMEDSGILCALSVPEDGGEGTGGGVFYGSHLAEDRPFMKKRPQKRWRAEGSGHCLSSVLSTNGIAANGGKRDPIRGAPILTREKIRHPNPSPQGPFDKWLIYQVLATLSIRATESSESPC